MPSFVLPIIPTPQARARHSKWTYKEKKQSDNEDTIKTFLKDFVPEQPLSGAINLSFKAYLPIPKSKSKKWKEEARNGLERPTKKPDIDNLFKNIADCMTQMRFWEDDKQIVESTCSKFYSDEPRWEVTYYVL